MTKKVKVRDKYFELSITENEVITRIKTIARELQPSIKGKNPLFVCVLNGAFMFAADLLKCIEEPCEVSFVKYASYHGASSSGAVKHLIGLNEQIQGRLIVVVEDIIDTGITMHGMLETLRTEGAGNIIVVSLLAKPAALKVPLTIDYIGFDIPNDFVVGYGLDYNGMGRNLPGIYKVVD